MACKFQKQLKLGKLFKMYGNYLKTSYEGAHFYKGAGNDPATLLKYEFLYRYFPKI